MNGADRDMKNEDKCTPLMISENFYNENRDNDDTYVKVIHSDLKRILTKPRKFI
jgi:hypothetical protein